MAGDQTLSCCCYYLPSSSSSWKLLSTHRLPSLQSTNSTFSTRWSSPSGLPDVLFVHAEGTTGKHSTNYGSINMWNPRPNDLAVSVAEEASAADS
ncbi:hypothetical protein BHE74_00001124 [Ensete ventricosum]|nr:hypothetical protein GW17_00005215 [Ensete ventricosum]RWW89829.1 hypothetical protein BHE74_00001124 [Ensete ventricosum]RZR76826.1 hypothetical protein BHM03_00001713 [Ensete ventricosum]